MDVTQSTTAPQDWDAFLKTQASGSYLQCAAYAEYVQKDLQFRPRFLQAKNDAGVQGQLLLFESSRYYGLQHRFPYSLAYPLIRRLSAQLHWNGGPVASSLEAYRALLQEAKQIARQKKKPIVAATPHPLDDPKDLYAAEGFAGAKAATFIIDVQQPLEKLWDNVDKAARKLVRRTQEQVTIRHAATATDWKRYLALVNENRKKNKLAPYPDSDTWWDLVSKRKDIGTVFLAERQGELLGGLSVAAFNGYVIELGAGTSASAFEEKIYVGDAIKWAVIEWAHQNGFRQYDLCGVNPEPKDAKENGIYKFKQKWGGALVHYHAYDFGGK